MAVPVPRGLPPVVTAATVAEERKRNVFGATTVWKGKKNTIYLYVVVRTRPGYGARCGRRGRPTRNNTKPNRYRKEYIIKTTRIDARAGREKKEKDTVRATEWERVRTTRYVTQRHGGTDTASRNTNKRISYIITSLSYRRRSSIYSILL
uniref:Uncharacterized protein n=1 Tax=Sipha flava TaxID=143950 RepID=A0A2S2QH17_9HEMI